MPDDFITEALAFSGVKAISTDKPDSLLDAIYSAADEIGVPREVARKQLWQESRFKPNALSPKGAHGVAQFMPGTAKRYKVNTSDPYDSIRGWKEYMGDLLKMFKGDLRLALAGYNAGEGAVQKYGNKVPPYRETQDYVQKILDDAQIPSDIKQLEQELKNPTAPKRRKAIARFPTNDLAQEALA